MIHEIVVITMSNYDVLSSTYEMASNWHHQAITNAVVTRKTRSKDPHISEGGRAKIHPCREEGPETGVRLSPDESTNILIRSTKHGQ